MAIYVCVFFILLFLQLLIRNKKISLEISEKLFRKIMLMIAFANCIAFVMEIMALMSFDSAAEQKIIRDTYGGTTRQESYTVQIGEQGEEQIDVQVSPRIYEGEELKKLFADAKEELDRAVLGENASFDRVTSDLSLPSAVGEYPFAISWELSRYDVLELSGKLVRERIIENDPENKGIPVTIRGTLGYEEEKTQYEAEVTVFAGDLDENAKEALQVILEKEDKNSRKEEYLVLPEHWNGEELIWRKERDHTGYYVLLLSIVIGILLAFEEKQKKQDAKKSRRDEMLTDYPEIISQFTMLLGAGMTAKNVWRKMTEDYKWQKSISGKQRDAYEEMLYTWQEMQSGIPEAECYERFGRRCELLPYVKMGALLAQNLRKGARGIAEALQMEAVEAMEERRNRAKRLGEEASTKLLAPMIIMLVVVLAIVVMPAFWSATM